jgi:cytochrome c
MFHDIGLTDHEICIVAMAALALGSSTGFAAGDAAAGQQVFASHCSVCHTTEPSVNKIGPSLAGVFGRKSGTEAGFNYSL